MKPRSYLAIDIGAESGRAFRGQVVDGRLAIEETRRFPNRPLHVEGTLRWDLTALEREVWTSVQDADEPASVGIDTWAVDFVLLGNDGEPLEQPYHYRDARTQGMPEAAFSRISRETIYDRTGIQFLPFNTLFQLFSMVESGAESLQRATCLLTIPDYLNRVLSGGKVKACEFTNATTTQCYDPRAKDWAWEMLRDLGIPTHIFPEIVAPGTALGLVQNSTIKLVAPACHDTGSAVAAVPAEGQSVAWISSGTWSIMGVETSHPIIDAETLAANFTNEGGVDGTFRFSKNVAGLWLVQQCRETWAGQGQTFSYAELGELAAAAPPGLATIDPDDPLFLAPGDMPTRIVQRLRESGQKTPDSPGQLVRVVLESLAFKYRSVLEQLESLTGQSLQAIHVVGGGCQNGLLNQLTAAICGRPVIAGPVEASALGNLLLQMIALGDLGSIAEGRRLIRASFPAPTFAPQGEAGLHDEGYHRFLKTWTKRT